MTVYRPTEADWKLFRKRLPEWQENHMCRLCDEYAAILTGEKRGSDAFWEIEERIRRDKRGPGVMAEMSRSEMGMIIATLLRDGVIGLDDLEGFSEDLTGRVRFAVGG